MTPRLPPVLYHAHHGAFAEDLPLWRRLASQASGRVLALGCGTGRVALPLAAVGARVVGLDRDAAMLAFLKARLPALSSLRLLQADFTALPLASAAFSLAILPCNTYTTVPIPRRAGFLRGLARVLQPGGRFAFSAPNPALIATLPTEADAEPETVFADPRDGVAVQVSTGWQRAQGRWTVRWHYDRLFPHGRVERLTIAQTHHLRPLPAESEALQAAGFALESAWGDFYGAPLTDDAPYWVIVARRL